MSNFGWSYPAGCSSLPWDYEGPCLVCGESTNNCICPECPECREQGNPDCYQRHGLVRSVEQIGSMKKAEEEYQKQCEAEAKYEQEWARIEESLKKEDLYKYET